MGPIVGAALVGAGSSLLGGLLGKDSGYAARDFAKKQANLARNWQDRQSHTDWTRQLWLAQNSIKYRAEDAKQSGIHPLAALGASGALYSPANAQTQVPQGDFGDNNALGSSLSEAGSRIAQGILNSEASKQNKEMHKAQLEQIKAQTNSINAQTASLGRNGVGSTNFETGQGPSAELAAYIKELGLEAIRDNERSPEETIFTQFLKGKGPQTLAKIAYINSHIPGVKDWIKKGGRDALALARILGRYRGRIEGFQEVHGDSP